jgi:hypothetical protein
LPAWNSYLEQVVDLIVLLQDLHGRANLRLVKDELLP